MVKKPKLIIAEAGINHNGDLRLAKKLVDASVSSGANAVKFQTFKESEIKYKNITYEETKELKEYCDKKGIMFLSTPHSFSAIDFLDSLVPMYKVASSFILKRDFLRKVASKGKPILLSTGSMINKDGMATLKEIGAALRWIPKANVTLLHCVSKYPCTDSHLERVSVLKRVFGKPVGLSDHTKDTEIKIKCSIIEKHIMLDKNCVDKDVSLTPPEFKKMVNGLS